MHIKNRKVPSPGFFPQRITLELTNHCNISCVFCPRTLMHGKQGYIETTLAKRLLDEISEHLPVTLVPFFRGEPLLHPEWFEILKYAKEKNIGPVQLTSNATLLNEQAVEKLLDVEVDFVSFSLDTVDKKLYENTRRGGHYDKVVTNIKKLIVRKKERGLSKPEIQVSAVETEEHRKGMDAFIHYWKPFVDRVRIYVEHSQSGSPGSINEPLPVFEKRLPCRKVFTDLVIYWDGQVGICNHDWVRLPEHAIGDVSRQSIEAIWTSSTYQKIREKHIQGDLENEPPCGRCDHWKMFYLADGFLGRIISGQGGSL